MPMTNREFAVKLIRLGTMLLDGLEGSTDGDLPNPSPRTSNSRNRKRNKSSSTRWTPDEDRLVLANKRRIKGRTKSSIYSRRYYLKKGN